MTNEEIFKVFEQILENFQLNKIQKIVISEVWSGKSYDQIAKTYGYDYGYVKDVGADLWQLISKALDKKVTKLNLRSILTQYAQPQAKAVAPKVSPGQQDWGEAIDVSIFYGRTTETNTLNQWIAQDHCRVVSILGMGGMGKTALSVTVAQQLQPSFDFVIWRSLRDAPLLNDLLGTLIKFLSNQQRIQLPEKTGERISCLIECLRESRCLIILDNFDTLLTNGDRTTAYRKGYENYGELIQRLGEIPHQSCLLLTSREKPNEIAALEGHTLPVRSIQLTGLNTLESQKIFAAKGLDVLGEDLQQLVNIYRGNPLALKIAATSILDLFDGQIAEFWQQGTHVFNGIYALLESQIKGLSALEEKIMFWLAISREPTLIAQLQADIIPAASRENLLEALERLIRRSLIEKTDMGYTQQPVVMEYMSNRLLDRMYEELTTEKIQFLIEFPFIKATAKEYIQQSQKRIFLEPIVEKLRTNLRFQDEIVRTLQQILLRLQDKPVVSAGYGGGNLINLLNDMEVDLSGYDFSNLAIWQADLRGIQLNNVNFANSDLSKSVFSETLGGILSVAITADSTLLAAGDTNGEIRVWQIADNKELFKLERCSSWVWSIAFSPTEKVLACCDDKTVKLVNLDTQKCQATLDGHLGWVYQIAYSPDGSLLATASTDSTVKIWDLNTKQCLHTLNGHIGFVFSVVFSPDGKTIASSSLDQTIRLWDVTTGKCISILKGHTAWVWSVAFSPDGGTLASGSHDQTIKLWDLKTKECLNTLEGHSAWVWSVAFSPNGQRLASSSDDQTVRVWDCQTGQCLTTLQGHTSRIWSVAFSPDGEFLASGGEDQSIRLWNMQTTGSRTLNQVSVNLEIGQCRKQLQGATNLVWSIAFSPDGFSLASGSEDRKIRLWNLTTGDCFQTLEGHSRRIWSVAYLPQAATLSPIKNLLVSSSDDHTIKLWDPSKHECLQTLQGHLNWVNSVTISPQGNLIASGGGDNTVRLWDIDTGKCLQILKEHTRWIWSVTFNSTGQLLASASGDGSIKIWAVNSGECLSTIQVEGGFVSSVAFSPTENLIAGSCGDLAVRIWDFTNLANAQESTLVSKSEEAPIKLLHTLQGHSNRVWSVAFSPQGNLLASGGEDCQVRVWDVQTGDCSKILQGHQSRIQSVAFSPQPSVLASGSYDETVRIWSLESGECLQTLQPSKLYEGMNIIGAIGLTNAQVGTLQRLGANHYIKSG
jgi:WD40 repeat protein